MATPASELNRFRLPMRIRATKATEDVFSARLMLADRIAGLPGIDTVENTPDTLPHSVDVFLQRPDTAARKQATRQRLCTLDRDGLTINGLSESDRQRVVASGWGRAHHDAVMVFMPRNDEEVQVCWEILEHAYHSLLKKSATASRLRVVPFGGLPRFSRTTLQ